MRIREFLMMNPPNLTSSRTFEDLEKSTKLLKKVFELMHVVDTEKVELVAYNLKNVSKSLLDQWKEGTDEDAPHPSWACFLEAFFGFSFPEY